MASLGDVKRRIKSVGNTKQITNAMNLVSASKLQKAKGRLSQTGPYFNYTRKVISSIVKNSKGISHPFLDEKGSDKVLVITITSDRGLCGGYNANICKETLSFIDSKKEPSLYIIGNKGKDYFSRRGKKIVDFVNGISEKPDYQDAKKLGDFIVENFTNGEYDEVYLAYTEFKSTLSHVPKVIKLLPVDTSEFENDQEEKTAGSLMRYEPSEEDVLSYVVPKYINTVILGALVEASTCEQAARMTSMDAATENANEVISSLTLVYNRARQSAITQEITEIVSGANALE